MPNLTYVSCRTAEDEEIGEEWGPCSRYAEMTLAAAPTAWTVTLESITSLKGHCYRLDDGQFNAARKLIRFREWNGQDDTHPSTGKFKYKYLLELPEDQSSPALLTLAGSTFKLSPVS